MRLLFLFILAILPTFAKGSWEEHRTFFKEHGYLWIKNFYSPEQMRLIQTWTEEIHSDAQHVLKTSEKSSKTVIVVPESNDPYQVCRTEDLLSLYPDLYHLIKGTITPYLNSLQGEPYVLFKDKLNFKWPGGGAFLPHQDFPAFEAFGPREHITAMVCIDPANLDNGCLQVAENWQETFADHPNVDSELLEKGMALLPYIIGGKDHGSIKAEYTKDINWIPLIAEPGDLVLISSYVPHYSEPNTSQKPRRALFLTLNKLSEGEHRKAYYHAKRSDPNNPLFHFATPTNARTK